MGLKTRHIYEFGPFRLEPAEHSLSRNERPVAITPKAFELLVFLVQNQGCLVTKDEVMAAVWPGCFVEEANLTVCISTVRKLLGEKDGDLRYIETIPKRGYRFTASVTELGGEVEPNLIYEEGHRGGPGVLPMSSTAAGVSETAREVAPVSDSAANEETEIEAAPRQNFGRSQWQARTPMLVLLAVAVLIGYLVLQKTATRQLLDTPKSVAILPFENIRKDPNDDFLGFSLADAVITKLGYVSSLAVRPSSDIEKYRGQVVDIRKVAADLNVKTLLTGNFIHDGDDLRITAQLIDAKSDKIVWRDSFDLKYDKLLTVQDKVAGQIIKGLALNISPSEAERLKPEQPITPVAYEYYLRGVDLYSRHSFPLAINMLEKSTEIDPRYALTWAYLGASYTSDAAFEFGGTEQYRRAQAAYERALAIQPSQLEAQMFLANLLVDTGKVEQAVPLLRDALKINPNYAAAHWELGYAYRFAGMLNESVAECERALQLDPLVRANGSVLNTYLYLGQYDRFLRSLPDVNDSSFFLFYRGFGEYYQKDLEQASRDFDRAYEVEPSLYAQIGKALSESIAHRDADGLEILRRVEDKVTKRGVGDPEGAYKIAQAYAVLGDKVSALRMLQRSVDSGFFCYPYIAADPLLNALHGGPQFGQILEAAHQRHEAFKSKLL
jgi:DNA-binding winged helix-turn-helix (wHTH) protein/TolB-like protein/cytochrome c-type biogenesis protein CcmH/NrfG